MRGRNRSTSNKGPNPLTRSYESNGPDVKIRGTAQNVADKYAQLARDAQSSGDPVAAENYFQHAEHYYRIIATAQEQYRQQYGAPQRNGFDDDEDGEGDDGPMNGFNGQPGYGQDFAGDDYEGQGHGQPQHRGQPYENRQDRGQDRNQDRGYEPRAERQNGRPNRFNERAERRDRFQDRDRQAQPNGNRQDAPRQDGFRQDASRQESGPRQDYARQDQVRQDHGRQEHGRQEHGRQDAPRLDNNQGEGYRAAPGGAEPYARPEPRRERRREAPPTEMEEAGGLPAFLTAPVRSPAPAPAPEAPANPEAATAEAGGDEAERFAARPRRRRRPRFEGVEGAAPAGDLAPTDTSSAE